MIDAHHHLWRYDPVELSWMTPEMGVIRRDFTVADLESLARAAGVAGTVAVQARRTEDETRRLLDAAAAHPLILGVVGWADAAGEHLDEVVEGFARDPGFVGLREVLHDMPSVEHATSAEHRRLVAAAERVDVAYDLLVRPEHLAAATSLVDGFPGVRFVVDHIGKPPRDETAGGPMDERRALWRRGMRSLAERPNVACKLSGLLTEGDWRRWHADEVLPFLDAVLDAFGPGRCMVGSDWPVCTLAAPYVDAMGLVADFAGRLADGEREAVLEGTARSWYRLGTAGGVEA
jgi:L-fuconolactonase